MPHDVEIFFPSAWLQDRRAGNYLKARLPIAPGAGLPKVSCGWLFQNEAFFIDFIERKPYVLKYREPGVRPNSTRWAKLEVSSVREAINFMNEHKHIAFLPAFVETRGWNPQTVAILN